MSRPIPAIAMPLSCGDVLRACRAGPEARDEFEEAVRDYHGSQAAFAVSSARAALWLGLEALKRLRPERRRVILPAYTCPTVGRAVMAAGLEGLCVDVSADDFNIDADEVARHIDGSVLAVISAHMFGTPCDMERLPELCRQAGAALIEDCAQACGAKWGERRVGTFGELAVLSLGRSKNLRGAGGGVLVVNDPQLVPTVARLAEGLPDGEPCSSRQVGRQLAISALSQPYAWNLAKRVPWLHVGAEDQSFDERPSRLSPWQAHIGLSALRRVDEYNEVRREAGRIMEQELADIPGVQVQAKLPPRESVYVRLATLVSPDRRDAAVDALQREGTDARAFYTRTMPGYGWWEASQDERTYRVASQVVAENLILPIHHDAKQQSAREIAQALAETIRPCLHSPS